MRILQIVPGSGGGFYCQNCIRDLDLAAELRRQGHDAFVVPLYLPLTPASAAPSDGPVFYGAVGLYLRHRWPWLSRLPAPLRRLLDALPLLRFAARRAASTRAGGLADLTVSMLRGERGGQADDLARLLAWLRDAPREKPDVIVLSNALLLGLAAELRRELRAPVVCWLQDEDVWTEAMRPAEAGQVWDTIRQRADDADLYVAVSAVYGAAFAARAGIDPARLRVVSAGVDLSRYRPADPRRDPPAVGYLSRLGPADGFDVFVEAFLLLRRDARWRGARLCATGGLAGDPGFLARQRRRLAAAGLHRDASIEPDRFREDRAGFLEGLSVLTVPAPRGDAGGLYLLEAFAAGVPVVQPRVGAYPEILQAAGCGALYEPNTPQALAGAWAALLADPARREAEARRGRAAAEGVFALSRVAGRVAALYADIAAACAGLQPGRQQPEGRRRASG
jgi:glycosyltransferase involved in cell wall biosynthesis